jgi:hypothetical protein
VLSAGAYGFTMASNYNTRPMPAEILVDGAQADIVRERQTLDDVLKGEHVVKDGIALWIDQRAIEVEAKDEVGLGGGHLAGGGVQPSGGRVKALPGSSGVPSRPWPTWPRSS